MRLDTRAFARAAGVIAGVGVFLLTVLLLVTGSAGTHSDLSVALFGYSVSVVGAFIGAVWALAYGYVIGAAFAFIYNIAIVPAAPPPFVWNSETEAKDS